MLAHQRALLTAMLAVLGALAFAPAAEVRAEGVERTIIDTHTAAKRTCTCECTDKEGKKHKAEKDCTGTDPEKACVCDCADPKNPKVSCPAK